MFKDQCWPSRVHIHELLCARGFPTTGLQLISQQRWRLVYAFKSQAQSWVLKISTEAHFNIQEYQALHSLKACRSALVLPGQTFIFQAMGFHWLVQTKLSGRQARNTREDWLALVKVLQELMRQGLPPERQNFIRLEAFLKLWRSFKARSCQQTNVALQLALNPIFQNVPFQPLQYDFFLHGNLKPANLLMSENTPVKCLGVLDWKQAMRGDFLFDAGKALTHWPAENYEYLVNHYLQSIESELFQLQISPDQARQRLQYYAVATALRKHLHYLDTQTDPNPALAWLLNFFNLS